MLLTKAIIILTLTWLGEAYGKSLFDQLLSISHGPSFNGAQLDGQEPFPQLVQRLGHYSQMAIAVIPYGRSLHKKSAWPHVFKHPRIVVSLFGGNKHDLGLNLMGKVFLGYSPTANTLEIISYNDSRGRFEFQLIKNFKANGDAELVNAPRPQCLSCHQAGGAIFAEDPWAETTNPNPLKTSNLILAKTVAALGTDTYFGLPLQGGITTVFNTKIINSPEMIDEASRRSDGILVLQYMWQNLCTKIEDVSGCRWNLVRGIMHYGQHNVGVPFVLNEDLTKFLNLLNLPLPLATSIIKDYFPITQKGMKQYHPLGISATSKRPPITVVHGKGFPGPQLSGLRRILEPIFTPKEARSFNLRLTRGGSFRLKINLSRKGKATARLFDMNLAGEKVSWQEPLVGQCTKKAAFQCLFAGEAGRITFEIPLTKKGVWQATIVTGGRSYSSFCMVSHGSYSRLIKQEVVSYPIGVHCYNHDEVRLKKIAALLKSQGFFRHQRLKIRPLKSVLRHVTNQPPLEKQLSSTASSSVKTLSKKVEFNHPAVERFYYYCGECHQDGPYDFLKGSDEATIWNKVRNYPGVKASLQQELMPPASSRRHLNMSERKSLMEFLKYTHLRPSIKSP